MPLWFQIKSSQPLRIRSKWQSYVTYNECSISVNGSVILATNVWSRHIICSHTMFSLSGINITLQKTDADLRVVYISRWQSVFQLKFPPSNYGWIIFSAPVAMLLWLSVVCFTNKTESCSEHQLSRPGSVSFFRANESSWRRNYKFENKIKK